MTPAPPYTGDLSADPAYSSLKRYLIESTGMAYYADKDADLARRVGRRLSSGGFLNCASYLELLRDPGRGPAEMDALVAEITIGETYFFRHRDHFDALRNVVLPGLIARNAATRHLRIWCAGCADGAEPYSLNILLRREMAHLLLGWDVSILGTDINRQFLASAREGRFEEWALRAVPMDQRFAFFEKAERAEKKDRRWLLAPEFRQGVSFQFHNLVEDSFPPGYGGGYPFDLIVCRNVMIYFGSDVMRRLIAQFHNCLAPEAWLLVGPSEPNMTHFTSFRPVNLPGVTLYQRHATEAVLPQPEAAPPPVWTAPAVEPVPPPSAEIFFAPPLPALAQLRDLADRGQWEDAERCGREMVDAGSLDAAVHFHYALVLEQLGHFTEAERSLRRAIYLDRRAPLPQYHLGLLLQSRGGASQALRCFENTLCILASRQTPALPELSELSELSDDDEGITDAELATLARLRIAALKERT